MVSAERINAERGHQPLEQAAVCTVPTPEGAHEVGVALQRRAAAQHRLLVSEEADVFAVALPAAPVPRAVHEEQIRVCLAALHQSHTVSVRGMRRRL